MLIVANVKTHRSVSSVGFYSSERWVEFAGLERYYGQVETPPLEGLYRSHEEAFSLVAREASIPTTAVDINRVKRELISNLLLQIFRLHESENDERHQDGPHRTHHEWYPPIQAIHYSRHYTAHREWQRVPDYLPGSCLERRHNPYLYSHFMTSS